MCVCVCVRSMRERCREDAEQMQPVQKSRREGGEEMEPESEGTYCQHGVPSLPREQGGGGGRGVEGVWMRRRDGRGTTLHRIGLETGDGRERVREVAGRAGAKGTHTEKPRPRCGVSKAAVRTYTFFPQKTGAPYGVIVVTVRKKEPWMEDDGYGRGQRTGRKRRREGRGGRMDGRKEAHTSGKEPDGTYSVSLYCVLRTSVPQNDETPHLHLSSPTTTTFLNISKSRWKERTRSILQYVSANGVRYVRSKVMYSIFISSHWIRQRQRQRPLSSLPRFRIIGLPYNTTYKVEGTHSASASNTQVPGLGCTFQVLDSDNSHSDDRFEDCTHPISHPHMQGRIGNLHLRSRQESSTLDIHVHFLLHI